MLYPYAGFATATPGGLSDVPVLRVVQDDYQARLEFGRDRQSLHAMQSGAVLMSKEIKSFSLDRRAADIVDQIPGYKPKVHKGKSATVSDCIIKYGDDAILSPRGRKHYEAIIGQLNNRIMELERKGTAVQKRGLWERIVGRR